MKKYIAGMYEIQWRGRGPVHVELTQAQAKALFEIQAKLSHEFTSIQFVSETI